MEFSVTPKVGGEKKNSPPYQFSIPSEDEVMGRRNGNVISVNCITFRPADLIVGRLYVGCRSVWLVVIG